LERPSKEINESAKKFSLFFLLFLLILLLIYKKINKKVIKKEVFAPSLAIDFDKKSDRTGHTPNS